MDPDSWRLIVSLLSSLLCALFALYSGISIEESSYEEETGTGLGVSYETVSSSVLSVLCMVCGTGYFYWFLTGFEMNYWLRILYTALFCCFGISVFQLIPIFLGRAKSDEWKDSLKAVSVPVKLFSLPIRLLSLPSRAFIRRMGVEKELTEITEEDVLEMMDSTEDDVIDSEQKEMISNIFELDDMDCGDIGVHRTEVVAVPMSATKEEVIQTAIATGFSRIPVFEGSVDNIVGIYLVKDLLPALLDESGYGDLSKIIRPVIYVPITYKASQLLRDFRQKKSHLAVVVDEYGGTEGIITLEDILESIVGDIEDEFDKEEETVSMQEDGTLVCDGFTEIEEVFKALGIEEPEDADEEYATIGGLVTDLLGYIPQEDEKPSVEFGGLRFTVLSADERRITSVLAERLPMEKEKD